MHNEWLNYSTLRLPAGNNSLFWLRRENDRMRRCRRTFISADSKCWQWQLKSQVVFMCFSEGAKEKQRTFGCTWCFVCDGVRAPSQTSQRPLLVPVWGQTLAFHWKNTVVYSDKNRASHSSLHDITGPEPCLISFINLWQFLLCKTRHIYEILPKENCRCTTNYSPEMLLSLGTFQVSSSYPLALKYI